MFGNGLSDFDIKSLFDTTTRLGQIVELLIYAVIALVVTTVILLIYGKFVKNRLKAKNNLTIRFTQNIIRVVIILIAVIWVLVSSTATTDIGKVLFQGTAYYEYKNLLEAICGDDENADSIYYSYDEDTQNQFAEEELTMSELDYGEEDTLEVSYRTSHVFYENTDGSWRDTIDSVWW